MKTIKFLATAYVMLWANYVAFAQNINLSNGHIFDGEPYLTIDPSDARHITVAWLGWTLTEKVVIKVKTSFDGGDTWTDEYRFAHADSGFTSADPSMAYYKDSLLYLAFIDYNGKYANPHAGGIYVFRSEDGGVSWDALGKALDINADSNKLPIDRPWVAADTTGVVFITSTNAKGAAAPNHPYLSVSYDGGQTFSWQHLDTTDWWAGSYIMQPMATNCVSEDGTFYAVYPSYVPSQNIYGQFILVTSTDQWQTVSYRTLLTSTTGISDTLVKKGYLIRSDPSNPAHLAFFFLTTQFGDIDVAMTESYDYGQTWEPVQRINDDPPGNKKIQDMVWADFDTDGDLVVVWRDRRNGNDTTYASSYEIYATYRMHDSDSFVPNFSVSDTLIPFDTILNYAGNDFLSVGLLHDTAYIVWGDTRNGKMNIWLSKFVLGQTPASVKQVSITDVPEIYPIPVQNNLLYVKGKNLRSFEIVSMDGKRCQYGTIENTTINTHGLEKGVYLLKITDSKHHVFIRKIIIP